MKITQLEWEQILDVMIFYHRTEGYINEVNGKIQLFDSDYCVNGVHSRKITIEEVKERVLNPPKCLGYEQ